MIHTFDLLVAWIAEHVILVEGETNESAAIWFVAVKRAEEVSEFNLRSMAELFRDGIPKLTPELVTDWLESEYDANDEHHWVTSVLESQLKRHFNIN